MDISLAALMLLSKVAHCYKKNTRKSSSITLGLSLLPDIRTLTDDIQLRCVY